MCERKFKMAFDGLPGMRVTISQNPQSFIIGDYFAVYDKESDVPDVYEWSMLKSYTELPGSFIITLLNGSSYTITKNCFSDSSKLIAFRSIVEGQISNYSHITKKVTKRPLNTITGTVIFLPPLFRQQAHIRSVT